MDDKLDVIFKMHDIVIKIMMNYYDIDISIIDYGFMS